MTMAGRGQTAGANAANMRSLGSLGSEGAEVPSTPQHDLGWRMETYWNILHFGEWNKGLLNSDIPP